MILEIVPDPGQCDATQEIVREAADFSEAEPVVQTAVSRSVQVRSVWRRLSCRVNDSIGSPSDGSVIGMMVSTLNATARYPVVIFPGILMIRPSYRETVRQIGDVWLRYLSQPW